MPHHRTKGSTLVDQLDQISDNAKEVSAPRTSLVIAFACKIGRRWVTAKYRGPLSECVDTFDNEVKEHGAKLEMRPWAMAYHQDGRDVAHPKNHSEAEQKALAELKSDSEPIPVGQD